MKRTPFEKKTWGTRTYYTLKDTARKRKGEALGKLENVEKEFEKSPLNVTVEGETDYGIVTSGVSYLHVREAASILRIRPHILKLGTTFPLPRETVSAFVKKVRTLIVVEELLPYLELRVTAIAREANPDVRICGKFTHHFGYVGEYNVPLVVKGISSILGLPSPDYDGYVQRADSLKAILPTRPPTFCPGCPHRGTLYSLQQALKLLKRTYVVNNDIGCYSMLLLPPFGVTDTLLDMGSCIGLSSGMQHVLAHTVVALVGDSTFFHAGLPGLVNAVHNRHDFTLVILDNAVTAMTGQQPNPGSDFGPSPVERVDLEGLVRAIGVKHVTVINAFDPVNNTEKIQKALEYEGVSVVISKGLCALYHDRLRRARGERVIPRQVGEKCRRVYACLRGFFCPALEVDMETGRTHILADLCNGCGVCATLCPVHAIESSGEGNV